MDVVGDFLEQAVDEDVRPVDLIFKDRQLVVVLINGALADSLKKDDMVALFEMEF